MKSITSTVLLIIISCVASLAQGVSVGLRAGLNLANATFESGSISITPDMKAGVMVGAYVNAMFTDKIGLQPEAYFSTQGFKMDGADFGGTGTIEQKLVYVNVPILLRYNIIDLINVHVGPQFGLLMSAESVSDAGTEDVKDQLKSSDLSAVFGAGVDLPFGLNGGFRYCLGLSNIDDSGSASNVTAKNKVMQIYIGYKLFGKK